MNTQSATASPVNGAGTANGLEAMKKPATTAPEHEKALYWRIHIAQLSRREVSEMTGYSESSISDIERGHNRGTGKKIDAQVMNRYRLTCAAGWLGVSFDWHTVELQPKNKVKIKIGD